MKHIGIGSSLRERHSSEIMSADSRRTANDVSPRNIHAVVAEAVARIQRHGLNTRFSTGHDVLADETTLFHWICLY